MARLIDAEKLKNEVASTFHGAIGLTVTGAVHEIIDRQPTIRGQKSTSRAWRRLKGDAEMTRKRFVKLLMAERFDRNEANLWADYYNMMGTSYAEAYEDMKPYLIIANGNRIFRDFQSVVLDCASTLFLSLADALERMREVFREVGNALREVNT